MAVAVSCFAAFLLFAVDAGGGPDSFVPIALLMTMPLATAFISVTWSVFGPGSYIKRLLWSHLVAIVVGLGYLAGGMMIGGIFDGNADDFFQAVLFVLAGIPAVSLAGQLPFWFFRFFFGWQFVLGESEPRESFTLRDIFVFTFLCALGFAVPQMAANLVSDPWFDPTVSYEEVTQPDGTVEYEEVILTDPQAIEQKRREHLQRRHYQMNMGFASTGIGAFVFSLLSFPVVIMMFRSKQTNIGCGLIMAYAGIWFVLIIVVVSFFGGGPGIGEAFAYLFFVLALYAACIGVPIAVSREHGFRLTSPRRYRMGLEGAGEADVKTSGSGIVFEEPEVEEPEVEGTAADQAGETQSSEASSESKDELDPEEDA